MSPELERRASSSSTGIFAGVRAYFQAACCILQNLHLVHSAHPKAMSRGEWLNHSTPTQGPRGPRASQVMLPRPRGKMLQNCFLHSPRFLSRAACHPHVCFVPDLSCHSSFYCSSAYEIMTPSPQGNVYSGCRAKRRFSLAVESVTAFGPSTVPLPAWQAEDTVSRGDNKKVFCFRRKHP